MPNKKATRDVQRNLHRSTGMWTEVWESILLTSVEAFEQDARRWLGDKSELSTWTFNRADWAALYEHFKGLQERRDEQRVEMHEPKTVAIPGLRRSITVREDPEPPKIPKGVHIMREGFPEGRYAVEIDGAVHCFWFKYHRTGPKRFQEETLYRKDGKWVSIVRYVPEWKRAIEIIKSDSYTQAVRFGAHTGHCSACGRQLTRKDSLKRGTGDTCAMQEIHKATMEALFNG
jgi:hypothetical protein